MRKMMTKTWKPDLDRAVTLDTAAAANISPQTSHSSFHFQEASTCIYIYTPTHNREQHTQWTVLQPGKTGAFYQQSVLLAIAYQYLGFVPSLLSCLGGLVGRAPATQAGDRIPIRAAPFRSSELPDCLTFTTLLCIFTCKPCWAWRWLLNSITTATVSQYTQGSSGSCGIKSKHNKPRLPKLKTIKGGRHPMSQQDSIDLPRAKSQHCNACVHTWVCAKTIQPRQRRRGEGGGLSLYPVS